MNTSFYLVFGLTRPRIESTSTISVTDALSTRPPIVSFFGFAHICEVHTNFEHCYRNNFQIPAYARRQNIIHLAWWNLLTSKARNCCHTSFLPVTLYDPLPMNPSLNSSPTSTTFPSMTSSTRSGVTLC